MIILDMDMPKSCTECPMFDNTHDYPTCYIEWKSSDYDFPVYDKRMSFCPIKCDIEDIKAEISEYKDDKVIHAERNEMIDIMLDIINKHIGVRE